MAEEQQTAITNSEQPQMALSMVENQKLWQRPNNNAFYAALPAPYYMFYNNWVRNWLYWYDGYVPYIHGGQYGLLSTNIGTTIVNRVADNVFGGDIMFANSRKPIDYKIKDGKQIGKALDFISNEWVKGTNAKMHFKQSFVDAFAAGFSLLKLNRDNGELWVDHLRADRFYVEMTARGEIRRATCLLAFYNDTTPNGNKEGKLYQLVEDRYYAKIDAFGKEIPVVEYKIYDSSVQVQYFTNAVKESNYIPFDNLPKNVYKAYRAQYDVDLNKPHWIEGFTDLGVFLLKGTDGVSGVPQVGLAQSILANVTTYLYEYDYYNTCLNTEMYLARGRVMIPKAMQSPQARSGSQNAGLDSFLYTKYDTLNNEGDKPLPIQFELRSQAWRDVRNILLESISTGIGLSASTLASYLQDGAQRTAREISAEESATTLFVENARRRFEEPINALLKSVLRFYGYTDDVEIRWSRAGMTNQTVLVDVLARAVQSGLISKKKAHHAFNYDDDEEQNEEDYKLVEQEQAQQQNSLFGGFSEMQGQGV